MIYAVQILDAKFVKIGFCGAEDVSVRIAQLQTGNPFEIKKIFSVEGTLRQEQTIHQSLTAAFGKLRIPMPPNEWYPGTHPFFVEFLEHLKYGFEFGLAHCEKYNVSLMQLSPRHPKNFSPNFRWPASLGRKTVLDY